MLKLICSDVDGTLVPDGGHDLNPEYFTQIRHLKKNGILFAAVSGRSVNLNFGKGLNHTPGTGYGNCA